MLRTIVQGAVALAATVALASTAGAGGRGGIGMFHPAGIHGGGFRMARPMPPVAGTWHVRTGRSYFTGFGHTNTAYGGNYGGAAAGRWGGGHTNTQVAGGIRPFGYGRGAGLAGYGQGIRTAGPTGSEGRRIGFWRNRLGTRFAGGRERLRDGARLGYGYGGYRYGGYGLAGYGGDASPSFGGGYVELPLASQYAEPPLNQGGYAGGGDGYPSVAGTGGPKVIVINNNYGASGCNCSASRAPSPVVYRFGVGSYY